MDPRRRYWHDVLAYNYRMTNIQAAIGLAQLEQADEILAKKRAIADIYRSAVSDLPLHRVGDADADHDQDLRRRQSMDHAAAPA